MIDNNNRGIKQIWLKYRKTLGVVRQHGGGRVVTTFHDFCNEIRSESPATESTETGLESVVSLKTFANEGTYPL